MITSREEANRNIIGAATGSIEYPGFVVTGFWKLKLSGLAPAIREMIASTALIMPGKLAYMTTPNAVPKGIFAPAQN